MPDVDILEKLSKATHSHALLLYQLWLRRLKDEIGACFLRTDFIGDSTDNASKLQSTFVRRYDWLLCLNR